MKKILIEGTGSTISQKHEDCIKMVSFQLCSKKIKKCKEAGVTEQELYTGTMNIRPMSHLCSYRMSTISS
jgi:hypothetical protein